MSTAARSKIKSTADRSVVSASGLRLLHSYVSAFIAPTIVFFAISGSLQIFDLHEAHDGYKPSALVSSMARLHKNQVFASEPEHAAGPPGPSRDEPAASGNRRKGEPEPTLETKMLKVVFALEG